MPRGGGGDGKVWRRPAAAGGPDFAEDDSDDSGTDLDADFDYYLGFLSTVASTALLMGPALKALLTAATGAATAGPGSSDYAALKWQERQPGEWPA